MKFHYVSRDVELTGSMKEACEEKLGRFDHYFRGEEADATVRIEILQLGRKSVEVTINVGAFVLRAKTLNDDFYNAIDELAEKLEGQMRKVKTQVARSRKANSLGENLLMEQIEAENEDEKDFEIVRHKTLSLTPMDEEEALARMDALGHSFFIYLDSSTGLVNVLYERDDHGYGVIEIEK